jgi:hypothetical protein
VVRRRKPIRIEHFPAGRAPRVLIPEGPTSRYQAVASSFRVTLPKLGALCSAICPIRFPFTPLFPSLNWSDRQDWSRRAASRLLWCCRLTRSLHPYLRTLGRGRLQLARERLLLNFWSWATPAFSRCSGALPPGGVLAEGEADSS